jgi:hypothetical protein
MIELSFAGVIGLNAVTATGAGPGAAPDAPIPADRILREEAGAIVVGSNVEYAESFHAERPLWPQGELPASWNERIAEAARSGIEEAVEMIMGQAGQRAA